MSGAPRRREITPHKRAMRSAPCSGRITATALPPPSEVICAFGANMLLIALKSPLCAAAMNRFSIGIRAAPRHGDDPLQHGEASLSVDPEAPTLGGNALACAMHELTACRRRLAE